MFDWRQLRRWKLSEAALPKGSIVINKETKLWDFKYYIFGGLALFLLQSFADRRLLLQRRRKNIAEQGPEEGGRKVFETFSRAPWRAIFRDIAGGRLLTANAALARDAGLRFTG